MKTSRKYAKRLIKSLPPVESIRLLKEMQLPKDQYNAVLHVDVMDDPLIIASMELHVSMSTLKRSRAKAFENICKTMDASPEFKEFAKYV